MRRFWAESFGLVAQLGERLVRNEEVRGSIPLRSTPYVSGEVTSTGRFGGSAQFRVRYRDRRSTGRTPALQAGDRGSSPRGSTNAPVASMEARFLGTEEARVRFSAGAP